MRMKIQLTGDGKKPKRDEGGPPPLSKERLIHVPALLHELFDYPRSSARMMIALGNVSLNGDRLTVADLDIPAERLSGGTLCCAQHTALLRGTRPEAVMESL